MTTVEKKYREAVGRRKLATARVRAVEASKNSLTINEKDVNTYFPTAVLQTMATESITKSKLPTKFKITARVSGGGTVAQAEAVRHGITRILVAFDPEQRKKLKKAGFLKRDPRVKERRKFGLKKARKSPQWSKR